MRYSSLILALMATSGRKMHRQSRPSPIVPPRYKPQTPTGQIHATYTHEQAHEVYRALLEAHGYCTAYGSKDSLKSAQHLQHAINQIEPHLKTND